MPRFIDPDTIKNNPYFTTAYELYKKYLKDNTPNASSSDEVVITKTSSKTNNNHNAISCDHNAQCSDQRGRII